MANQIEGGSLSPWLQKVRVNRARPYLMGNVLDIGCGNGYLASFCSKDNYFGFDVDTDSVEKAVKAQPQHTFSLSWPEKKFDSIAMLAVIEHIKNPLEFIQKITEFLNQQGRIIITTPHPYFDWVHTLGAKVGLFSSHASDEHEKLLGINDIKLIANKTNLNLVHYQKFLFGANQLFILEKK